MLGRGDWKKIEDQVNGALGAIMKHVNELKERVSELEAQIGEPAKEKPKSSQKAA